MAIHIRVIVSVLFIIFVSGCETLRGAKAKHASIAFKENSGGSLSIWNAEMSAAVAYNSGEICMQRALAVKSIDADTSVKVSAAMLSLAKSVENNGQADLVSVTNTLKETAQLLTTSTERTTFLNLGMFYLCQISANGGLTDTQTAQLIHTLIISGSAIGSPDVKEILANVAVRDIKAETTHATPKVKGNRAADEKKVHKK